MKIINTLIASVFISSAFAQIPLSNQKSIGGTGMDRMRILPDPHDNGYIVLGTSISPVSGDKTEASKGGNDIWFVKTDNSFAVLSDKTIGGNGEDELTGYLAMNDRIFVSTYSSSTISGDKTMESFGGTDTWLLCLDLNGNILWQNAYGGSADESLSNILDYSDSSIVLSITSNSPVSGNKTAAQVGSGDIWVIEVAKLDGHIIRQAAFGSENSDAQIDMFRGIENGHILFACVSNEGISGDKTENGFGGADIWLVELNENFEVIKDVVLGGNFDDTPSSLLFWNDSYYLLGTTQSDQNGSVSDPPFQSGYSDYWLLKLDNELEVLWDKRFGGSNSEGSGTILQNGNGLIISGISFSQPGTGNKTAPFRGFFDTWMLLLDENGNILGQESYGGLQDDYGFIVAGHGDEVLLSASSDSPISGNKTVATNGNMDGWFGKVDVSDFLELTDYEQSSVAVYPNPFTDRVTFAFDTEGPKTIRIFTAEGKVVESFETTGISAELRVGKENTSGILFYEITGEEFFKTGKLVRY